MMDLYEAIDKELKASEAALEAHKEGVYIHQIVSAAFAEALESLPKPKKKKSA